MENKKLIKIYDIRSYIESIEINGEKFTSVMTNKLAIIKGKEEVLIFQDDGCGWGFKSTQDEFEIPIERYEDKGTKVYFLAPELKHIMTIQEMIDNIPYQEMLITDYMDYWKFKRRVKDNLLCVLDAINKIGLKSSQYCTKKYIKENCRLSY